MQETVRQQRMAGKEPVASRRAPAGAPPLDREALLRAFTRGAEDYNRQLDGPLEEFEQLAAAYLEERRRPGEDPRRQRALYERLVGTHRTLCELRASLAAWLDAWALINPSSRVRMQTRGTWPLPEIPSLQAILAARAERAAPARPEPMAPAATGHCRHGERASKGGARREAPRHLRLLPHPPALHS